MNAATARRLLDLNREFYQTFGREFSSTRQRLQPGVQRVLGMLNGDEAILDLGCGNGEVARELMRRGHRGQYTGLDFSLSLLEFARHGWEDAPATFLQADLTGTAWDRQALAALGKPCNLVTAFATLHHIPRAETRLAILNKIHALLAPGGRFVHSEWQFLNSERLRARIQAWEDAGLSAKEVDPGDHLLDWRGGGKGLRYVHHFDQAELEELATASRFRVRESFLSDGENGLLGMYQVWEKA
jgi:SAM-dependent methyltransferase